MNAVYSLYRRALAKELDPMTALWQAKEIAERLEQALAREQELANAMRAIETVLGEGVDCLCRVAGGWAVVDQGGDKVLTVPSLLLLGRALEADADRVHRERAATRLREQEGRDHYAWRGGKA
jgi:hypothetical protein